MRVLLRLAAGLTGWAAAFCILYALHGIGCAAGWQRIVVGGVDGQRLALLATWAAAVAGTVALAIRLGRSRATPLARASAATGWAGAAATAALLLPIVLVPSCL